MTGCHFKKVVVKTGFTVLVLGIGPTQGLEHTLTAEKMYSINFTVTKKEILFKFAL